MDHPTIATVEQPPFYFQDDGIERQAFQIYKHESLDCDSIRLLRLIKFANDAGGEEPRYDLVPYNRLLAPEYVALSYVWGKLGETGPIFLGNDTFL
jgi:hypothetical protein